MGLKGTNGDRRKEISKRFRPQCAVLVSDEERPEAVVLTSCLQITAGGLNASFGQAGGQAHNIAP